MKIPRVLIVAGSDSGGGAGIQADIKTITALGGYAATAITALTAQNTKGVYGIVPVAPEFVAQQMQVVLEDIGTDAIKTGMMLNAGIIEACAAVLRHAAPAIPIVVDPVMISTSGSRLLQDDAVTAMIDLLISHATILMPNLPEAEALLGRAIATPDAMVQAAMELQSWGASAVLIKGGHLAGDRIVDVLVSGNQVDHFQAPRLTTRDTHGTGCTLASAIAFGLAAGHSTKDAVIQARDFVRRAIETAPGFGEGSGPLNHMHRQPWKTFS